MTTDTTRPAATDTTGEPATAADTRRPVADRLKHARELIIRAVAVLSLIDRDDADDANVAAAREITAELRDTNERLARLIGEPTREAA